MNYVNYVNRYTQGSIILNLSEEHFKNMTTVERENIKLFRYNRLMNESANLQNPLFLAFRRQDWTHYLNDDVKTFAEYYDGLNRWMAEDADGALDYKHYKGTFMSG